MKKQLLLGLWAVCGVSSAAWADRLAWPAETPPAYQRECGGCHLAYHPALLASADWQRLMDGLSKHFGTDARLEDLDQQQVSAFLRRFGGSTSRPGLSETLRITRTPRFLRKHDEVPPRLWKDARVKSAANCEACHGGAAEGRFSEHDLRLQELKR